MDEIKLGFHIEHIFAQSLYGDPDVERYLNSVGLQQQKKINQIALFTNADLVEGLQDTSEAFQEVLNDGDWGATQHGGKFPDSFQAGKNTFLDSQFEAILELDELTGDYKYSEEARKLATYELFEWTRKLVQGKIKDAAGSVIPVIGIQDIYTNLFTNRSDFIGVEAFDNAIDAGGDVPSNVAARMGELEAFGNDILSSQVIPQGPGNDNTPMRKEALKSGAAKSLAAGEIEQKYYDEIVLLADANGKFGDFTPTTAASILFASALNKNTPFFTEDLEIKAEKAAALIVSFIYSERGALFHNQLPEKIEELKAYTYGLIEAISEHKDTMLRELSDYAPEVVEAFVDTLKVVLKGGLLAAAGEFTEFANTSWDAMVKGIVDGEWDEFEEFLFDYGVEFLIGLGVSAVLVVGGTALAATAPAVATVMGVFLVAGASAYTGYQIFTHGPELYEKITEDFPKIMTVASNWIDDFGEDIGENIGTIKQILSDAYAQGFAVPIFENGDQNFSVLTKYLIDPNDVALPDKISGTEENERFFAQNNGEIDGAGGNDELYINGLGEAKGGVGDDLLVLNNGRIVEPGELLDGDNPDGLVAQTRLVSKLDGGDGDDVIVAVGAAEIFGGAGDDIIYSHNPVDPQSPKTYGDEREEVSIDAGAGNDWVIGIGAADINLGEGNDWLISAGVGSVISTGPGGANDRDSINMVFSRGSLITDADGFDRVYALGALSTAGSYLRHIDSESPYFYGWGGAVKLGLNSAGELMVGDFMSDHGVNEDFLYLANYNNNPLAPTAELTAGIRTGEFELHSWRLLEGPGEGIARAGQMSMWDFVHATIKDIFVDATVGGVDPLVFDLDGDGLELSAMVSSISPMFDMDGDGFAEHSGWVAPDDGFLAFDKNANGKIDDIDELFGGADKSGFAALAAYDDNEDGVIDVADAVYSDLRIWRDLNSDAVTGDGELFRLSELDIASIDLTPIDDGSRNALNVVARTGSFTRGDGSTGTVGDVEFRVDNFDTVFTGDTTIAPEVAATMPALKGHGTLADLQVSITLDGVNGDLVQTISNTLPTLNVLDLELLSERAFGILEAWMAAPPEGQTFGANPDTPALISRVDGKPEVIDFAIRVSEEIEQDDGTTESVTYWKRAGGTVIRDENGDVIDYPSFDQIMAHQPGGEETAWEVVSSQELTFIERYFGEDIPIDRTEALTGSAISGLGNMLARAELLVEQLALRLAMQGGLSDYFEGVAYSVETDRFSPTTDYELIPFFTKIFESAPDDATAAEAWLKAWKPLVDTLLSDYDRPGNHRITEPFLFTNVVAAYENVGLPIDIVEAADRLGVSREVIDAGVGVRTGTSNNDIFYLSAGDDVIESKSGSDAFVVGRDFGHDVINDYESGFDGFDTIRFAHLTPEEIVATREGKDLVLTVIETGDTVRVTQQFHDLDYSLFGGHVGPHQGIEEVIFANGAVWGKGEIMQAVSHSLASDDNLTGTDHSDLLDGGAGDDFLSGGDGFDIYRFDAGYGHDVVHEQQSNLMAPAEDLLLFGEGLTRDDISFQRNGGSSDLVINTTSGDSLTLKGQFSGGVALGMEFWFNRVEYFQFENSDGDSQAFNHADIMRDLVSQAKTDGDDQIYGFAFEDVLDGGAGDDYLSGGDKNDTYVFGFGYGADTFDEGNLNLNFETVDRVRLGAGVTQDDLTLVRNGGSNDLTVQLSDGGQFTIKRQFFGDNIAGNHYFAIESIDFEDGSSWDQEYIYNKLLENTDGDDSIYGFWRDDIMDGGAGNDYLNGGDGNDTYLFGLGSGQDVIYDGFLSVFTNKEDRLLFGEGVTREDIVWTREGSSSDLTATLVDGSQVTIENQFGYNNLGHRHFDIEIFEFADGSTISVREIQEILLQATDGDDVLYGFASNDVFDGGAGNDVFYGGEYADTYHFGYGYDHDRVIDHQNSAFIDAIDRIVFGDGISAADLSVSWEDSSYKDLKLSLGAEDSITIVDYRNGPFLQYVVEEFHFQDGTVWQTSDLFAKYLEGAVTAGDDVVSGLSIDDVIDAGAGNDTIYGQEGNDILVGGLGDDTLYGGSYSDTYRYALGDGNDLIVERHSNGNADVLEFTAGIDADAVTVSRSQDDLEDIVLTFADGGTIVLEDQFSINTSSGLEFFRFTDGTEWTAEEIGQKLAENAWTDGDDTIKGLSSQDDFLFAGAGNDTVYGYSGNDTIIGGLGDDYLDGGRSSDTYRYALGDGADTIYEKYGYGSGDRLQLGDGILAAEVGIARGTDDLNKATLTFKDGGSIVLVDQLRSISDSGVEIIEFADGTLWHRADLQAAYFDTFDFSQDNTVYGFSFSEGDVIDAGAGNDTVYGYSGGDTITGGLGDDYLDGGKSSDTYHYALGDGSDTIYEQYSSGKADKLVFGEGILAGEVGVARGTGNLDELTFTFKDGGSIRFVDQFRSISESGVESFEFADGTIWDRSDLTAAYFASFDLDQDNTIYGFGFSDGDVIDAGAGNDTVYGYSGSDTLTGGLGDDYLDGGKSSDTYHYALGDGSDTIYEKYSNGKSDRLVLGDGILVNEVAVERGSSNLDELTLTFKDGGSIRFIDQFRTISDSGVEYIEFADGTVLQRADLQAAYFSSFDFSQDNTIYGFGDSVGDAIDAGAGNDTVYGYGGEDTLAGGLGDDFVYGGKSSDTYIYNLGDGTDTIFENHSSGRADKLLLAGGILAEEVTVVRSQDDDDDVTLFFNDGGSIFMDQQFWSITQAGVETIEFEDGTTWDKTQLATLADQHTDDFAFL